MKILKSDFLSKGIRCDGDLLFPEGVKNPPVIIMAHGLAAQKNFGLLPYAKRFVEKNIAVFLFDYRSFGKSDGLPRQNVDPYKHLEDRNAAIAHVRNLNGVNTKKIALWGSSFSGGHVLSTASRDSNIVAVIAQVPFVSAFSSLKMKRFTDIFKSTVFGIYDQIRSYLGLGPHYSKVIGHPGQFAAMNTDESYDGFMSLVGGDPIWENKMTSRGFLKMATYNPGAGAKKIESPVLIMAAKHDSLIPLEAIQKVAEKIHDCKIVIMNCNHFAPYTGAVFKDNIDTHINFMCSHLL
ncbi:alpha/beta hydrolase [Leptospira saintgironsiae]|uniref:Serine aminopeptidase S33 domain-containing protein n=1 Tax=Leptospira saintgironsiae TaxID=2023183 RepID=A0A2M9YCE8_9LEPT|nr:alpha/beta fold hydrolase [Leptospira saintgironsiae]PJZ49227.1 hypothetical protein CH362_07750 [Leptospira saintgironsiae]